MSIAAINWALNCVSGITSTQKAILIALADRANEENKCWPSYDDICERSCANRKSVVSALKKLEELGLIQKTRRYSKSTVYELLISTDMGSISRSTNMGSIEKPNIGHNDRPNIGTLTINEPSKELPCESNEPAWVFRWLEFWTKYPSSKNKKKSEVAFKNLSAKDQKAAIAALSWYEFSSDKKYIPMASTWINGRRWEDEDGEAGQTIREVEW